MVHRTAQGSRVAHKFNLCKPISVTMHRLTTLAHDDLMDFNTLHQPERIKPVTTEWHLEGPMASRTFPPNSFTVLEFPLAVPSTDQTQTRTAGAGNSFH